MNSLLRYFAKLDTYFYKTWYMFTELCFAYVTKRKRNILFITEKNDLFRFNIKRTFRFLPHKVTFIEESIEDIKLLPLAEYDLIVPLTSMQNALYLNELRDLIKDNPIPMPSTECVLLCDDKYAFAQKLIANNFGDYIPQIDGELPYPYFLKKKIDDESKNTYFIENREQELALLSSVNSDEYFRQKFVSGTTEYCAHIFFNKQQIVRSITLICIYEKDGSIRGKDAEFGVKMMADCPYLDLFTDILNSVGFQGICHIDYKVIDGRPCIFELNPVFGGSDLALYFFSFLRSID